MRLDKFLKTSRLIKRRTIAAEACDNKRVLINGKAAKSSAKVSVGDEIEISFGSGTSRVKVLSVTEHATKESARDMYEII